MMVFLLGVLLVCDGISASKIKRQVSTEAPQSSQDVFIFKGIINKPETRENVNSSINPIETYTTTEYTRNDLITKTTLRRRSLPNRGPTYDDLKSVMFYKPSREEMIQGVKSTLTFHTDADDVRSTSRNALDYHPLSFYTPKRNTQELERMESVINKVNDKRQATPNDNIKPVHENVEEDVPYHHPVQIAPLTTDFYHEVPVTTEYPKDLYEPYYSYGPSDYAYKDFDEDPVSFKGVGYNYDQDYYGGHDVNPRNRRLGGDFSTATVYPYHGHDYDTKMFAAGDSATEKGFVRNLAFDKQDKVSKNNEQHNKAHEDGANSYRGIKDIVDTFANKYGMEDNNKKANFELKTISDKMDKRKGFRRVYHKDEYQEDNEFFDNTGHTAKSHEQGSTALRNGGQEGTLQAHSAAALDEAAKAHRNSGLSNEHRSDSSQSGHENSNGYDKEFNKIQDAVKKSGSSHVAVT